MEGESQGQQVTGPDARAFLSQQRLIFDGHSFTSVSPRRTTRGTFRVQTATRPLRMSLLTDDGNLIPAIFELRGGRLFLCMTRPGDPPPNEFKTTPGSSALLTVYERVR